MKCLMTNIRLVYIRKITNYHLRKKKWQWKCVHLYDILNDFQANIHDINDYQDLPAGSLILECNPGNCDEQ